MLQHNSRKYPVNARQLPEKGQARVLTDHLEISKVDIINVGKEIVYELTL